MYSTFPENQEKSKTKAAPKKIVNRKKIAYV